MEAGQAQRLHQLFLQPFINKMGGAVASGVIGAVVILSGIKDASTAADVTPERIVDDLARRRELNLE